ncbi:hypothetical protein [Ornithinimicrobium panacihumi]|uniref:hypothetical protein n=1 Tax=Ornithinimicrobium panacihumi TaxID=2008449 RepID=UPI003F88F569
MFIPENAQWLDLEPFLGVANRITALYVFQPGIDVGPLCGFSALTELIIQPGRARTVDLDLDAVPALRTLSTCRPTRFSGGAESGLRDLHVERPSLDALEVLAQLPRLERLKIYGAFPEYAPASLRVLDIAAASAPARVSPLPRLEELHLTKVTDLADLSLFAESERLRKLVVEDVPSFRSYAPFHDSQLRPILIGDVPLRAQAT